MVSETIIAELYVQFWHLIKMWAYFATCEISKSDVDSIKKIKEKFGKVELSMSSYDTAWIAMVPTKGSTSQQPYFPQCLDWVLENQNLDGSWGLNCQSNLTLVKDSLSSTLTCLLALQKWNVGHQQITRGLDFMKSKEFAIYDNQQSAPIGFDIIFPGMIQHASKLGLNIPLDSNLLDMLLRHRDLRLKRNKTSYFGYVGEGLNESYDWKQVMEHKRTNGSLFNSPATTAASQIHLHDEQCLHYLKSVLDIYGMAVPAVYPFKIYSQLSLVDNIERLGIARFFSSEIETVLDEAFSCWKQQSEEIFMDVDCLAMAFRLLRLHGYPIESEALKGFVERDYFFNTVGIQHTNTRTILELHKASEVTVFKEEPILEKIKDWTSALLMNKLGDESNCDETLYKQVENRLEHSIDTLDRIAKRRSIELYNVNEFRLLKTHIRSSSINNMELLVFSIEDYNNCQDIMQADMQHIQKWIKETKFDTLIDNYQLVLAAYFLFSADRYEPEYSDARILVTKLSLIATFLDDMFDIDGTMEELSNLQELVERWDDHSIVGFSSPSIETVFSILYHTLNEYALKASILHGRSVKDEIVEIFVNYIKCMRRETQWWLEGITPSLHEIVWNGAQAAGCGVFLTATYFLGTKLSLEAIKSEELDTLFNLGGGIGRLMNDFHGSPREDGERKVNAYDKLICMQGDVPTAGEDAKKEFERMIEQNRREIIKMIVNKQGSCVPSKVKETFWTLRKICFYLYTGGDQYRYPTFLIKDTETMIYEPIPLPSSSGF